MAKPPQQDAQVAAQVSTQGRERRSNLYSHYVLMVMMLVYVFNFVDRQIISILAEEIKADLGVTDSQLGFLYGTAFAVFYSMFGIPLGRLADGWHRSRLISVGLAFWSAMTALSGTAKGFASLAVYRIGVGIGEASATPAALSLLADYYSKAVRNTVMALYSSGIYIGAGIGLAIGGLVVDRWDTAYAGLQAPFGLKGWQVAYLVVGMPGLLMALWVWTLKEPERGAMDGVKTTTSGRPFRDAWREMLSLLPVLSWWAMRSVGCVRRDYVANLLGALGIALGSWALIAWTGDVAQWVALGGGCYATLCWLQTNRMRDPVGFSLMFHTPSFMLTLLGFSSISFVTYGVGFWGPPFFQRVHGMGVAEAGNILGASAAVAGGIGVILGGVLGDLMRRRSPNGGLQVSVVAVLGACACNLILLTVDSLQAALVANFFALLLAPMWIGIATSTVVALVLPRLRALAAAFYILVITFIGLALGPYSIGVASRMMNEAGMDAGEALRLACIGGCAMMVVGGLLLVVAMLFLPRDEHRVLEKARALGEDV